MGALSIFIYLSYLNVDYSMTVVMADVGFFRGWSSFTSFMLFALFGGGFSTWRIIAPLLPPLDHAIRGEPVGAISDSLRRRALALPRAITLVAAVIWLIAGIIFARAAGSLAEFVENFFLISVVAGLPSMIMSYVCLISVGDGPFRCFFRQVTCQAMRLPG